MNENAEKIIRKRRKITKNAFFALKAKNTHQHSVVENLSLNLFECESVLEISNHNEEKVYLKTNQHKITHWNADKEKHPTSYEPVIIRNKMVWLSARPESSDLWICMIVIWIRAFQFPYAWRNLNFESLNFLPKHMNLFNHVCTQKTDFEMFIGNCRAQFNCLPCKMIDSYF